MKTLKVLAIVMIATFCYTAVSAKPHHRRHRRRHHHVMVHRPVHH